MALANPEKLKVVTTLSRRDVYFSLARVPRSSRVFLGCSDFKVYEADLAQPKPDFKEIGAHNSYVTGVALHGTTLLSCSYDGRVIWWDTEKKAQIRAVDAHQKWIRRIIISPDGKRAASVADDMVCKVWDVASGKMVYELRGHQVKTPHHFPSMLYASAFSADSKLLATGDKVGHIVLWDLASGKEVTTLEAPVMYTWDPVARRHSIGGIRSLAFSPDGTQLAVGGMGKVGNIDHLEGKTRVEVFDWQKGQQTHLFAGDKFNGLVNQLRFHPQGEWLLGAGGAGDGFLLFYDLKSKKTLRQEKAPMHIHDVALNEEGNTLYTAGHNKIVVFDLKG